MTPEVKKSHGGTAFRPKNQCDCLKWYLASLPFCPHCHRKNEDMDEPKDNSILFAKPNEEVMKMVILQADLECSKCRGQLVAGESAVQFKGRIYCTEQCVE